MTLPGTEDDPMADVVVEVASRILEEVLAGTGGDAHLAAASLSVAIGQLCMLQGLDLEPVLQVARDTCDGMRSEIQRAAQA